VRLNFYLCSIHARAKQVARLTLLYIQTGSGSGEDALDLSLHDADMIILQTGRHKTTLRAAVGSGTRENERKHGVQHKICSDREEFKHR